MLALLILSLSLLTHAKKDAPRVVSTKLDHPFDQLFYFDDSDVIITVEKRTNLVYRSTNAGEDWKAIKEDGLGAVAGIMPHPLDKKRAYILGRERTHFATDDQGKTWRKFETDGDTSPFRVPLAFHGRDPNKILFEGCLGYVCEPITFYTEDNFKTTKALVKDGLGCTWAVSEPLFGIGIEPVVEKRIFCIAPGEFSPWSTGNRLVVSDDYYKTRTEAMLAGSRAVSGVIKMAPVKKYLVAAVKAEGTDELALYVSDDSSQWHRADFQDRKVLEKAYTILESTNYSMQVDVKGEGSMGTLFTSNSNGTYFTRNIEHTNHGHHNFVDFEKITGIQGIVMVNVVKNWKEVARKNAEKEVISQVSFDDGRTFHDLKVGKDQLHLHSVTDPTNVGKTFSSNAPGIVMGVGNTGDHLKEYKDGDLFVSDDAGLTWRKALKGPHKYEFGDQGAVLMAVPDDGSTDEFFYSLNHGKDWKKGDFKGKIMPGLLTTVPDSTSLKFLIQAQKGDDWVIIMIDYEGLHERKCGEKDFERWAARLDDDGKPSCIMGHKQFYRRRKADADCFVEEEFKDPLPQSEPCKCAAHDFECDYNYVRSEDRKKCNPATALKIPAGKCEKDDDKFTTESGFRLIPGDDCEIKGGEDLTAKVERPCKDATKAPALGEISTEKTTFDSDKMGESYYLERTQTSSGDDETIVLHTGDGKVYLTKDHGKKWQQILKDEKIVAVAPHQFFNDAIYFLTSGKKVFYSLERGDNLRTLEVPEPPHPDLVALRFHPDHKDTLLWTGATECGKKSCGVVYRTENRHEWSLLLEAVQKCQFISREGRNNQTADENLIFCEQYEHENPDQRLQLLSSNDWFKERTVHFEDILDFATMAEFIIVAAKTDDHKFLKVDASVGGQVFAPAEFPPNFKVEHQRAYTVLDSSTHAVFLHVTVNNQKGQTYGTIIKSNSNGTSYSLSRNYVNRDDIGYVDFEKMQGLEGVAMINVVSNVKDVEAGKPKRLQTLITHNDGADWALMPPPAKDNEGKKFACVGTPDQATDACALHIHHYTERIDKAATFSSPSAIGIMLVVGNVGDHLESRESDDTYTFITRDGGIHWNAIKKGNYLWEYGDQGSIIIICERNKPTKVVYYTLDEGITWREYEFSPKVDMEIQFITTTPSDNSRNFLLWGKEHGASKFSTVNIDFTGLKERQRACVLQDTAPEADDYELWEPKHPLMDDNCLFGHVAQYHRKRLDKDCYNGFKTEGLHNIARNCSCTRQDFEW